MAYTWSDWRRFPDAESGNAVDAPSSPGVYEVRHTLSGRAVAFGATGNIMKSLSKFMASGGLTYRLLHLLLYQPPASRLSDLEYRTHAAASRAQARITARRLLDLRHRARRT